MCIWGIQSWAWSFLKTVGNKKRKVNWFNCTLVSDWYQFLSLLNICQITTAINYLWFSPKPYKNIRSVRSSHALQSRNVYILSLFACFNLTCCEIYGVPPPFSASDLALLGDLDLDFLLEDGDWLLDLDLDLDLASTSLPLGERDLDRDEDRDLDLLLRAGV